MRNRLFLKCLHCSVSIADKVSKALLAFPEGFPKPMKCRRKSEHVGTFSQWVQHEWAFFFHFPSKTIFTSIFIKNRRAEKFKAISNYSTFGQTYTGATVPLTAFFYIINVFAISALST
jgi:hypothetical protein